MESKRWKLNSEQLESIKKALIKYTSPLLLVFLLQIQQGQPMETALYTVYAAALQLAINVLSKLVTETK